MNSLSFPSSLLLLPQVRQLPPYLQPPTLHHARHHPHSQTLSTSFRSLCSSQPPGTVAVANFEDLLEKDYSFLDSDNSNSLDQQTQKANLIISQAQIQTNSRVLVSIPSEDFVDRLVDSSPCQSLLVVHDSLFVLCGIKEKYDQVKCWQGELIYVPENWAPFDVVFLCYLPALPFQLNQIFEAIAKRSSAGARVVISFPQGRDVVEQHRKEYPDVVISDLPQKTNLEKVAADHSFEITNFVDEPGIYLAVLKFCGEGLVIE